MASADIAQNAMGYCEHWREGHGLDLEKLLGDQEGLLVRRAGWGPTSRQRKGSPTGGSAEKSEIPG